ncbi:MAG TPA: trypsin-like peptidase domain-containing protein, partial [Gemmataceae bacterium]
MRTMARITPPVVLLLLAGLAWSEERNRFADVLALQEAVHESIERAEPSVACILVSRSDKYKEFNVAQPDVPGRLGRFARPNIAENDPRFKAIRRLDLSDPNNVPESYGSGVVIDEREGLVLTLAHVVRKATKVYVRLPGGRGSWADIHAADPRSDLAVLRLIDRVPNLKALKLGDGDKLRKGDFVLSLSNPFAAGFADGSPSASWGIVSNLRRRSTGMLSDFEPAERTARLPLYCFNTLIQTDTRLNLGCSGGALLNLQGKLVGLTSSLAGIAGGETPGGFAVPLSEGMRRVIEVLRRGEEVEYGFLGVFLRSAVRVPDGHVQIDSLLADGPAERGQIRGPIRGRRGGGFPAEGGDFILSINGMPVRSNDELFLSVGMHLAGSDIRVEVAASPDGPRRTCSVRLAKFPVLETEPIIASHRPEARRGLRVDWTSTLVPRQSLRSVPRGVIVCQVQPGSPASAHIQQDMIIKRVND